MAWSFVYDVLPFLLSGAFKAFSAWGLPKVIKTALRGVPGGAQRGLTNESIVSIVTRHVDHAEAKILVPLTYFASAFAAVSWGAKEGRVGPAVVGAFLLVVLGGFLVVFVNQREAGTLDDPCWHDSRMSASAVILALNLFVDALFITLIALAYLQSATVSTATRG